MSCYNVVNAACLRDYKVFIEFEDGSKGVVDLQDTVGRGGVFRPLARKTYFCEMKVDPKLGTICWPNGADLSPDFLYERLKQGARA